MNSNDPGPHVRIALHIPADMKGLRADHALAILLPDHSRSTIQNWMRSDHVCIGGRPVKPSEKLSGLESVDISIPPTETVEWEAESIPLDILYEDRELFIIHKPAGLVVHPGAGNPAGTLLNGLLNVDDTLRQLPRAGIVHRLDKDTSGLMVVARTEPARQNLIRQLAARSVRRDYLAVSTGVPVSGTTLTEPIARHPTDRRRMSVSSRGKPAITHVRVLAKYRAHSLLGARLETGRTHQIRVHLAWWGYPLVGDPVYGGRMRLPRESNEELHRVLQNFRRQALHATALSLIHPATGMRMSWKQSPPEDFGNLISTLEQDQFAAPER